MTNSATLPQAIDRAVNFAISARGRVVLPAVKGAIDPYTRRLERLFSTLGKPFSANELVQLCRNLARSLDAASGQKTPTQLSVAYEPAPFPRQGLVYGVQVLPSERPTKKLLAEGQLVLPCIPSRCDVYLQQLANLFDVLTYPLNAEQLDRLRERLQQELEKGYLLLPQARIRVVYGTVKGSQTGLTCKVSVVTRSIDEQAREILAKTPDYLAKLSPLVKVTDVANSIEPRDGTVLVAGLGTAQHAIPLARQGFNVNAIDLAEPFAQKLQEIAEEDTLPISIAAEDLLDPLVSLPSSRYHFAVVTEIAPRLIDREALHALLSKLSETLIPGGTLLLNLFLAADGVEFDTLALEAARAGNATIVTRSQLDEMLENLPLELTSVESVLDYEKTHRSENAQKLDPWYVRWASGQQVFAMPNSPISLHWLTLQRGTEASAPTAGETQF
ncbi:MAG: hypothetical protein J7641_18775 [Cyanobacteria bacterium SID2]|nr:hypothetical protein [Cyanobacteria bacterium SID2]MBP0005273.1 hypothetical protein [Cyanobacteria bacterium SBC]